MFKRLMSSFLVIAMLTSTISNVLAYSTTNEPMLISTDYSSITGEISFDIRFDSNDLLSNVYDRNIKASLSCEEGLIGYINLNDTYGKIGDHDVSVETYMNEDFENDVVGAFRVLISELEPMEYTLTLTGENHLEYTTNIDLTSSSQHLTIGTGIDGFTYGDFNNDGQINDLDLDVLSNEVLKNVVDSQYDINGDNAISIADLTAMKIAHSNLTETVSLSTKIINPISIVELTGDYSTELSKILDITNNEEVPIYNGGDTISEETPLTLELNFSNSATGAYADENPVYPELSQLEIKSPIGEGQITGGTADVTYVEYVQEYIEIDGEQVLSLVAHEFTMTVPLEVNSVEPVSIARAAVINSLTNTVTINLGNRVAVKVITVNVTAVEGTGELAVVTEVNFIQDIVPEDPYKNDGIIVWYADQITAGDKSLSLTWNSVPNVGGYRVYFGEESGKYTNNIYTTTNSATISGLENLVEYYIVIQAVLDDWSGPYSNELIGIPQPKTVPGAPRDIIIEEENQGATFSWKNAKDGETYNVYIQGPDDTSAQLVASGITGLSYIARGLVNDEVHYMQVSSSNEVGEGPKTSLYEFTPTESYVEGPILPTYNRISSDKISSISLVSNNRHATYTTPGFTPEHLIDGEFEYGWVPTGYGYEDGFVIEFTEGFDMDYLIAVEKLDGAVKFQGYTGNYNIQVWCDEFPNGGTIVGKRGVTGTYANRSVKRYTADNDINYMLFDFPAVTNVTKIRVGSRIYDGAANLQSFSELAFYKSDDIEERTDALFADELQTTLAEGVSQAHITSIRNELDLAEDFAMRKSSVVDDLTKAELLLSGDDSYVGYVKDDFVVTNGTYMPMDVWAPGNFNMRIFVEGVDEGETLNMTFSQFYDETGSPASTNGISLTNGENFITVPSLISLSGVTKGGSTYYTYSGGSPEDVRVHFYRMIGLSNTVDYTTNCVKIPSLNLSDIDDLFESETEVKERITAYVEELQAYQSIDYTKLNPNETTLANPFANWYNIGYNSLLNPINSTEISYKRVLHSIPATSAWSGLSGATTTEAKVNQLFESALAWDELLTILNYAHGYEENQISRQHNRYMRQTATSAAYAAGNHIGIGSGWASSVMGGTSTNSKTSSNINLFGWGYAHEFGHNLDRIGDLEASNNLYSQLELTWDGDLAVAEGSRVPWASVYNVVAQDQKSLPNDVFVKLGMYWQLHLAYSIEDPNDSADINTNPFEFYHLFNGNLAKGMSLPVAASTAVERDLTNFFDAWGYSLSSADKSAMSAFPLETRNIEFLNDSARAYRINGGAGADSNGTFSVSAQTNGTKVTLTIEDNFDSNDIIGYKIFRDNKGIGFASNGTTIDVETGDEVSETIGTYTFTDVVSSINNVSFEYQVQPVDKLGNFIGSPVSSETVRISYNDTHAKSDFTVSAVEGGYKYTVNAERAINVSGIVIEDAPTSGAFEVSVTSSYVVEADTVSISGLSVALIDTIETTQETKTTVARSGDFAINHSTKDNGEFLNYFNKPNVDPTDTRIAVYDALEITVIGEGFDPDKVEFIQYVGDSVEFTDYKMGRLTHDFDTGGGILYEGDIIVVGNYVGDPYFNEIYIEGKFADGHSITSSSTEYVDPTYTQRYVAGDIFMFAEVPEGGAVTTISDGLFIFKLNVAQESAVQDYADCSHLSLFPSKFRAIMTLNDSTGASRTTSYTSWESAPDADYMPDIIIQ